uniref:Uncharacterized protein n=1 Tax=Plectus sambesii TaxID=2011161 RepID=A0A914XR34_9BILA
TLYFSQFTFNAVYLVLFIYDNNIRQRLMSNSSNRLVEKKLMINSERSLKQGKFPGSQAAAQEIPVEV